MNRKRIQLQNAHLIDKSLRIPESVEKFAVRLEQFKTTYGRAKQLAGDKAKLIYRLDLATENLPTDDIYASKIGGVPDLCATDSIGRFMDNKKYQHDRTVAYNFPTVSQFVADNWPRCPVCFRPMRFLAQINIWDWLAVLHQLTAQAGKKKDRFRKEQMVSALGDGYLLFGHGVSSLAGKHLTIWHCASFCSFGCYQKALCRWSNNGRSALESTKSIRQFEAYNFGKPSSPIAKSNQAIDMFGEGYPWTISEYIQAVNEFIAGETKIETWTAGNDIPSSCRNIKHGSIKDDSFPTLLNPNLITDAKIGFDLADEDYNNEAPDDPIFHSNSDFVLFGRGRSQQEPLQPLCANSYFGPHRMAPIICYDEPDNDLTHQIYSCLTCGSGAFGGFGHPFPGILDSSCT